MALHLDCVILATLPVILQSLAVLTCFCPQWHWMKHKALHTCMAWRKSDKQNRCCLSLQSVHACRQHHLNSLIKFKGVVTRRTGVFPQLQMVKFNCTRCSFVVGPFFQNTENEIKIGACPSCQSQGPFEVCHHVFTLCCCGG